MRFDTSVVEVAVPIVFVVDRHSPRRASLQSRLVEEGYHTLAMQDADETLQTLGCVRADLLVVDARAVSDGAERFLTALRSNPTYAQLPVLFVGAGLTECLRLRPAARPGGVLMEDQPLDDVLLNVRSFVAPLMEPYN